MATGHFLRKGDKTTCGGSILSGSPNHNLGGLETARNGDPVSCGKDGKIYHIAGGIPNYWIHGVAAAGTLHSRSTCPCKARLISSFPYASYGFEEAKPVKAVPVAAAPLPKPAKVQEPVQHAQVAKKTNNFAGTCKPEDNPLRDGVYIWTETNGAGHAFISVHENNNISLYTYGRYGRTDRSTLTGDGILDYLKDESARKYYRYELYQMGARVFRIDDADPKLIKKYFENLWDAGKPPIQTPKMQEDTKLWGRTIDKYDVTGSNCTTHSVEGLKFAGSHVFDNGYRSTTTQLIIESTDDFTIPISLQRFLESKSSDMSTMLVVEMTNIFKQQYPNIGNQSLESMGGSAKLQYGSADTSGIVGTASPYSGGTVGGSLGSTYDDE